MAEIPTVGIRRPGSVPCGSLHSVRSGNTYPSVKSPHKDDPFSVLQSYALPRNKEPGSHDYGPNYHKNAGYLKRDEPRGQGPTLAESLRMSPQISAQRIQELSKGMISLQDQIFKLMRRQETFAKETTSYLRTIADSISSIITIQNKSFERFTEGFLEATQKLDRLEAAVDSLKEVGSQREGTRSLSPKLSPHYPRFVDSQ